MSENQEFIDYLFSESKYFLDEIFNLEDKEQEHALIKDFAIEIIYESPMRTKLNFCYMNSFAQFDIKKIPIQMTQIFMHEVRNFFKEDGGFSEEDISAATTDKKHLQFLYAMSVEFFKRYRPMFYKIIVDTFFELLKDVKSIKEIPLIATEVVHGTVKQHSLMLEGKTKQVANKPDQIWMQVQQANQRITKEIDKLKSEISDFEKKVKLLSMRLEAMDDAKGITQDDLEAYTLDEIRDIFTEDDDDNKFEKLVLSYLSSGDLSYFMEQKAERGIINAKLPTQKADFRNIAKFFASKKFNNTENALKIQRNDAEEELPKREKSVSDRKEKLEIIESKTLDQIEPFLKRVKEVMIKNLATHRA